MKGTQADLARHLGVNRSSISRAVAAGRIRPDPDGSYDYAKCTAAWHASAGGRSDVAARHAAQRGAAIPKAQPTAENAPAPANGAAPTEFEGVAIDDGGRTRAKALVLQFENAQIKLEMALRRGLRLDRAAVKREAFGLGAMLRAGVERVIDQTAPRIAAAADDIARRRIVEAEIRRLRWVLKREMPRALRRMREQGAQGGKVGAGGPAE